MKKLLSEIIAKVKAKGDPILWNPQHWTKRYDWVVSTTNGILAQADHHEIVYDAETGRLEKKGEYRQFHGTGPSEYLTTIEKGLSKEDAYKVWIKLTSE